MSIGASVAAFAAAVTAEIFIGGRRMTSVVSGTVDTGFDSVASSATAILASDPGGIDHWQDMEIRLGWDGRTQAVWAGYVEATEPRFGADGFQFVVTGAGQLAKALLRLYDDDISYTGVVDEAIVADLLTQSGVHNLSIDGDSEVLGVIRTIFLSEGTAPWDIINEIDQVLGYKTFDFPDGTVRRRKISGNPSSSASKTYTEGVDIFEVGRPRTVRGISNVVRVIGQAQNAFTPASERVAPNPLIPTPPTYIVFDFQSDLIETTDLADRVSERLLIEVNRLVEQFPLVTKGDPRRVPGETVKVVSSKLGIGSGQNYWVKHVHHEFGAGGFTTTLTLEGGTGATAPTTNIPPEANFTYLVTRETYLISGTPTDMYTVACDGSASYDPDGLDGSIAAYAWANNKNADVGTAATYATAFTQAEMNAATKPTITLTVTDALGATGTVTQTITAPASNTLVRDLYIAAGSRAEATSDGGKTWQTWTPGAGTVRSTPTIAGADHSYFGLSDGKLYHTDDYLATAPTLVHDFGSQVNCIWINEVDANRVTVGLANGEIHRTGNADQLGSSTWTLLTTYGATVLDIVESQFQQGQYRVSTGDSIRITYDEFVSDAALITWSGGTARQIIPSLIGLPGKGTATGTGPVKSEDGTTYTYATTAPTDVHAGTHHIRLAILLVVDRTGKVWTTADAGTVFTNIATLPASDPANRAIRDGDNQMIFYVAADDGAYKSFDGGLTWKLLRDYAGGSLFGQQIGYGGLRALAIAAVTVVSDTTWKAKTLWNGSSNDAPPDGWRDLGFNDTAWAAAVVADPAPGIGYALPTGASRIWEDTRPAADIEQVLLRKAFAIGTGQVAAATLIINADDAHQVWINGVNVYSEVIDTDPASGPELGTTTITLDPAILLANQNNQIAVHAYNYSPGQPLSSQYAFHALRLEVS